MILSDGEIQDALSKRKIIIDPIPTEEQYSPSAVDLFMGDELFELKTPEELAGEEPPGAERPLTIDLTRVDVTTLLQKYAKEVVKEPDGSFILVPRKFALGITREWIRLPGRSKVAARVEGRSSLARLGLVVHMTAPTIHAKFEGKIVLEMYNFGTFPLRLRPGQLRVCQLIFERLGVAPKRAVIGKFNRQTHVRGA